MFNSYIFGKPKRETFTQIQLNFIALMTNVSDRKDLYNL